VETATLEEEGGYFVLKHGNFSEGKSKKNCFGTEQPKNSEKNYLLLSSPDSVGRKGGEAPRWFTGGMEKEGG